MIAANALTINGQRLILSEDQRILESEGKHNRTIVQFYGDHIVRIQRSNKQNEIQENRDSLVEMIYKHDWQGQFELVNESESTQTIQIGESKFFTFYKKNQTISFHHAKLDQPFLVEKETIFDQDSIAQKFNFTLDEHFTGLGHDYFGRAESVDLKGRIIERNYGTKHREQAPLIVPFYLSNKGYGVFVNSTYPNRFSLGYNGEYNFSLKGEDIMDYFVIWGPDFRSIIEKYTELTGRPRLPLKAFFGLALSDKGNDHNSTEPSDETWWKKKIIMHKQAQFPLDHVVNDNRWRAGGGQRCMSYFDWDTERYPNPSEYSDWLKNNGLISTLDFNRCIAVKSEGWKAEYNLPENDGIDFKDSAPDFTKVEVRHWFWNLIWNKSLNPKLNYPGDALWIDEFDEMGKAPVTMTFEDGSSWLERRNYWFFLIAKALVEDGWEKSIGDEKRPFVWVRGMTAGAQRYATLWSGDIETTYEEMKLQARGMQLAGISGFPFWGHDAGGFFDYETREGPNDSLYIQWSAALGSFSPFWKPHGIGYSRWPLDRPENVQKEFKKYAKIRYTLMPYTYSTAYVSSQTGLPMTRSMIIDHQKDELAWKYDLQYMWGDHLLVSPNYADSGTVETWLPEGSWYYFWDDKKFDGNEIVAKNYPLGELPLFVKAGSIIPMCEYALSTSFINEDSLNIHIYPGNDGSFTLYEDDGITEKYRSENAYRLTNMSYKEDEKLFTINPSSGEYKGAPTERNITLIYHGIMNDMTMKLIAGSNNESTEWDESKNILTVTLSNVPVNRQLKIQLLEQ